VSRRITLGVRLTPETLDALRLVARCQHITLSEAARRVLTDSATPSSRRLASTSRAQSSPLPTTPAVARGSDQGMDMTKFIGVWLTDAELVRLGGEFVDVIASVDEVEVRNKFMGGRKPEAVLTFTDGHRLVLNQGSLRTLMKVKDTRCRRGARARL
jgi:hypothetical protein